MWILYDYKKIEAGVPVLAYHPDWICEDFNPKGVRMGYYSFGCFYSAKFSNDTDNWWSTEGNPTHIMDIPKFIEPIDKNQLNVFER